MTVAVDGSAIAALLLHEPLAVLVERQLVIWRAAGEERVAPSLAQFEVARAMTRAIADSRLRREAVSGIWQDFEDMNRRYIEMLGDGPAIVEVALRLRRKSAYDAAYVVLAQRLGAELWTLDGALARNAQSVGYPVRLFEDS